MNIDARTQNPLSNQDEFITQMLSK